MSDALLLTYAAIGRVYVNQRQQGIVEFAAKGKKGKGSFKECKDGFPCGYSCISRAKTCRSALPGQAKQYADWLKGQSQKVSGGGGSSASKSNISGADKEAIAAQADAAKTSVKKPSSKSKASAQLDDLPDLVSLNSKTKTADISLDNLVTDAEKKMTAAKEAVDKAKKLGTKKDNSETQESAKLKKTADDFLVSGKFLSDEAKIAKMTKLGLTTGEAQAIATWISTDTIQLNGSKANKYSLMNQAIYAKDTLPPALQAKIEAANILAINGYKKLPSITPDAVAKAAKLKDEKFDADAPLLRHMNIQNDPAAFVARYKASIGKVLSEDTHFATTHKPDLNWVADDANITYKVTPKWDGTGSGKYIDGFKNYASEGEIMFVPGTKFRVKSVTDPIKYSPPAALKMPDVKNELLTSFQMANLGDWGSVQTKMLNAANKAKTPDEMKAAIDKVYKTAQKQFDYKMDDSFSAKGINSFYAQLSAAPQGSAKKLLDYDKALKKSLTQSQAQKSQYVIELEEI